MAALEVQAVSVEVALAQEVLLEVHLVVVLEVEDLDNFLKNQNLIYYKND
jgi:hypothetical protein